MNIINSNKISPKSIFESIYQWLIEGITIRSKNILFVYFVIISLLEIFAYVKGGVFSIVASRIWLLTAFSLFLIFIGYVIYKTIWDIRNKKIFNIIGFLCLLVILFYYIGNLEYGDINADATQQLAAGLSSFKSDDWNYTGLAFLGYANRQYIIAAIPSLLFGRSVFTLHLGFAGLFIIGLTMLYFEFRNWLKSYDMEEELALVPCYIIMAFRFIVEYYLNYEQAITPVALTMMGIALFMKLYRKMDSFTVIAITWVGCFYCDSYTPIIASLGLLICFILLYMLDICYKNIQLISTEKSSNLCKEIFAKIEVLCGIICTIGCFFIATLLGKREDRLTSMREDIDLVSFAIEVWTEFFEDRNAVFFGIFLGIVLIYIFLALTLRLKIYDFIISIWVFGVVLFANVLVGYTSYEKSWILQRNMIIIPVLVTAIFLWAIRIIKKYNIKMNNKFLVTILLFFGIVGVSNFGKEHQSFQYFRYIQPMKYMISYAEDILEENEVSDTDDFNIILITDNLLQSNIYDYAKFFYPNAYACSTTSDGEISNIDWNKKTFIFAESEEMIQRWFDVGIQSRVYKNTRYKTDITWYYAEIR